MWLQLLVAYYMSLGQIFWFDDYVNLLVTNVAVSVSDGGVCDDWSSGIWSVCSCDRDSDSDEWSRRLWSTLVARLHHWVDCRCSTPPSSALLCILATVVATVVSMKYSVVLLLLSYLHQKSR